MRLFPAQQAFWMARHAQLAPAAFGLSIFVFFSAMVFPPVYLLYLFAMGIGDIALELWGAARFAESQQS
ncbi:MAG: hypothetical protein CMP86_02520 [Gammaproteobacteria bacterium]|nr:hypothetical protein [Gammaproteobacteria bacterium]